MHKSILNSSKALTTIVSTHKSINYDYLIHFNPVLLLTMTPKSILNRLYTPKVPEIN